MITSSDAPATDRLASEGVAVSRGPARDGGRPAIISRSTPARRWTTAIRRLGLLALLVAAVGVAAYLFLRPATVMVVEVTQRVLAPAIQGVGTVEAKVTVQVGSKITGRLVAVLVDQADTVTAGQVLARLDDAQPRAEVTRQDAAVRAAEAAVAEAEANVRRAQATLADLVAGARPAEIAQWQARVTSARATRVLAERELRRTQELYAKELIAAQDVDRARQAFEVAVAQQQDATHALDLAREGPRTDQVAAAQAALEAAEHQLSATGAVRHQAAASLAVAREQLADTVILSPFAGYVVSRELEPGAPVTPTTPIVKLADPRTAWTTVYVDARDTAALTLGDRAEITLRSLPGRALAGQVARIQREGDRVTEQLAVDVAFDERPARLILGEQVEVTIRPPAHRGATALPVAAVVRRPEGSGALVIENGRLRFAAARLGAVDPAGWVEVLGGLRPGAHVVLTPGSLADPSNEGRRVRITHAPAGP